MTSMHRKLHREQRGPRGRLGPRRGWTLHLGITPCQFTELLPWVGFHGNTVFHCVDELSFIKTISCILSCF